MNKSTLVKLGIAVVIAHVVVSTPHSIAHTLLQIEMTLWQNIYIALVILIGPILAAVLLWIGQRSAGFGVLALSMAGSLVFGVYYHFIEAGPDNVAYLHQHSWASTFQVSAVLLAVTELAGVVVGIRGMRSE
jgi:hypothetical protein